MKRGTKPGITIKFEWYKLFVSILFGLIGFWGAFHSIVLDYSDFKINILWSFIFPILVCLAWGYRYGLVSMVLGLMCFHPVFLWPNEGWACFIVTLDILFWVLIQGFGCQRRLQKPRLRNNIYFLQGVYSLVLVLDYMLLFPGALALNAFWINGNAITHIDFKSILIIIVKGILSEFIIIAICDTLLMLPFIRHIFRLDYNENTRHNNRIFLVFIGSGLVFWTISVIVFHFFIDHEKSLHSGFHLQIIDTTFLSIIVAFGIILGGVAIRFMERRLEFQEALVQSENKYRHVFENIQNLYFELALDGTVILVSDSISNMFNVTAEKLTGKNLFEVYGKSSNMQEVITAIRDKEVVVNHELKILKGENEEITLWLNAKVVKDIRGEKKIVGSASNVTKYVQAIRKQQESEQEYRILFEKMLNGFFVVQPVMIGEEIVDLCFIKTNPSFEQQLSRNWGDLTGRTWTEVFGVSNANMDSYQKVYFTGETVRYSSLYFENNYSVNAFKIGDKQIGVIFDNVTEYKRAVEEVQKLNDELELRVLERTKELQQAVHELEAFTYTVSHDLKSPIRAIQGYSRMLQEDYGDLFLGDAGDMLNYIKSISNDMIDMINKLLKYSITTKAPLNKELVETHELFCQVFEELMSLERGRGVELQIESELPSVLADRTLLKEAITNILSNSIKFTRNREEATIHIGCRRRINEYEIYVRDNGAGFDMSYASKLFGIFQRLHSNDEFEGSGIGLVTVKRIMEKHNGRVWIEGRVEEGTTVSITLPV